jgi:hypothetical protein
MVSFSAGVYDLFAHTIPGILYLFVGNEIARVLGFPYLKYQDAPSATTIALVILVAFILGHVMDFAADRWRSFGEKEKPSIQALEGIKRNHPNLNIRFQVKDRGVLLAVIRRNHNDIAATVDRDRAVSIMFFNISLGLLLYTIFLLANMLAKGFTISEITIMMVSFILSLATRQRGRILNVWFNKLIFEMALTFGTNTEDVLKVSRSKKTTPNTNT